MPPTEMSRSLSLGSPPTTKACASTTERVPAGRVARSAPDALDRRRQHGVVRPRRQPPRLGEHVGLEVGDAVDGDRTVLVLEQHGLVEAAGIGAQVHTGEVDQAGVEAEAAAGVVVAAR